jgi:hypothetical protein
MERDFEHESHDPIFDCIPSWQSHLNVIVVYTTMSVATPTGSSQSPAATSPANQDLTTNIPAADRVVIEYLRARGHTASAKALLDELEVASPNDNGKQPETVGSEEFVKLLSVFAQKPTRPGENILKDSANVLQELTAMGNPLNVQNLIASIGSVGAEELLSLDPTDKQEGFRELEAWVDGSLDMYRVCFYTKWIVPQSFDLTSSLNSIQYSSRYSATSTSILFSTALRMLVWNKFLTWALPLTDSVSYSIKFLQDIFQLDISAP